uniref:Cardio-excitatory peptide 1 n=2 Tax=Lissachatina fulica TaxID=2315439 RepID=CEP1_LISFU|nr:RecName: Full=Cardio-excitatory peptide 1; Short=ACEP-1 [Lissachatina fulica]
SGQSWRPQGRF